MPASALQSMPLEEALEHINVPSYLIDSTGVIRWVNPAARSLVGEVRGRQFTSVVAPEQTRRARELFARKTVGAARVTDAAVVLIDADGDRIGVEVSSVPLYQGEHVGRGRSTSQIAEDLHLSTETVRNHIRHLLRAVGAHSRLEAVAIANHAH